MSLKALCHQDDDGDLTAAFLTILINDMHWHENCLDKMLRKFGRLM